MSLSQGEESSSYENELDSASPGESLPEDAVDLVDPWSDEDRYWRPLLHAIGEIDAQQFDWKAETGTIQTYEHRETFRYVHIEGLTGDFYDQQCNVITKEAALAHAMPPVPEPETPAMQELESEPTPVAEDPGLDAFTRPYPVDTRERLMGGLAIEFDRSRAKRWSSRLVKALESARHGILQGRGDDSGEYPRGPGLVQAGGSREYQEPSLAKFIRRSSEFER